MPKKDRMLVKGEIETYAKLLHDICREKGTLFEGLVEIREVLDVINNNPALRATLDDDTLPEGTRSKVIAEVFTNVPQRLIEILSVMAERGDMYLMRRVVERQEELAEEALDIVVMDVTTVVPLDDKLREAISSKCADMMGKNVMLREHVDPSIIGGIVLGAHGKRIDASIATKLEKTRIALSSVTTGGER